MALDLDERERLVGDLGEHDILILRNHGVLTLGRTLPEAFMFMYYLLRACDIQIAAQAGGGNLHQPSDAAIETVRRQGQHGLAGVAELAWPGLIRLLDGKDPSYRT